VKKARFVLGVELLTGMVAGAAALSAVASLLITLLVIQDSSNRSSALAMYTVSSIALHLPPDPGYEDLRGAVHGLVLGETIDAVVVVDSLFNPLLSVEPLSSGILPLRQDDWIFYRIPESPLMVGVMPVNPLSSGFNMLLMTGLGVLAAGLTIIAIFTPGYLKRRVLAPLKAILGEADRLEKGAGRNPDTARASFHRVVELLADRDRELELLREEAEKRADAAESRAGTLLSAMRSSVLALDDERNLVFFNGPAGDLFDLVPDDGGAECPFDRSETGSRLKSILDTFEGRTLETEIDISTDEGERILNVSISCSDSGETVILLTDVTRLAELERRIAEETAMADLGAVSAGISHEVGNTLCALSGFIELLGKGHSDERTMSILSEAKVEVDSAREMVESFKALAGSGKPVSTIVPVEEMRQLAVELCDEMGDRCVVSVRDIFGAVSVDRLLMSRCISNLIRNSLEADQDSRVGVHLSCGKGEFILLVEDDGPGFAADTEIVFLPLYSTKRSEGNMGIGLTITRRIIAAFGGKVTACRKVDGKGAIVTIRLPLVKETN